MCSSANCIRRKLIRWQNNVLFVEKSEIIGKVIEKMRILVVAFHRPPSAMICHLVNRCFERSHFPKIVVTSTYFASFWPTKNANGDRMYLATNWSNVSIYRCSNWILDYVLVYTNAALYMQQKWMKLKMKNP